MGSKVEISKIKIKKTEFSRISEDEQLFFIQATNLMNDLITLQKCIYFSSKETLNDIERRAQNSQALFFTRLLAGKLYEGWQMLTKGFFNKLSKEYITKFSSIENDNLKELKSFFKRNNFIKIIRNEFEFHCPSPKRIRNFLKKIPDTELFEIFLSEKHTNCRYFLSDVVVTFAVLDAINEKDKEKAMDKLISEIHRLTGCFLNFLGGYVVIFLQQYPDFIKEEIIVSDLPLIDDVKLPYFIREPNKKSSTK